MPIAPRPATRRIRSALCAAALVLGAVTGAAAQSTAEARRPPGEVAAQDGSSAAKLDAYLAAQIESRWWKRREALSRGGHATAGPATAELLEFMKVERIRRLPELADAVVLEGRAQQKVGNLSAAREAYRLAVELDPGSSAAWWGAARAHWASGDGLKTFAVMAGHSLVARVTGFWGRWIAGVNVLFLLASALALTAAAGLIAVLARHAPSLVHLVDEQLPATWNAAWRVAIGWAVLLAPVGLAFLGLWALFVWAAGLIAVAGPRARRFVVACLVAIALLAPAFNGLSALARVTGAPAARVAVDAVEGAWRPDNIVLIERLERERPEEAVWKHLLARSLRLRDPDRSVALLRDAIELEPADPTLKVLLANMFFRLGKNEQAGVLYRDVLDREPKHAIARFNLSRVRLALFEFDESEELIAQVRRDDPKALAALMKTAGESGVVDPDLPGGRLATEVLLGEVRMAGVSSLAPRGPLSIAALVALVAGLLLGRRGQTVRAGRCGRCGDGLCGRCSPSREDDGEALMCRACRHLATRGTELAPVAREEQSRKVERHQARTRTARRVSAVAWPGLALIHDGRFVAGGVIALAWCMAVLVALVPEALLPTARAVDSSLLAPLAAVAAAVVWFVSWLPPFRAGVTVSAGRR